MPRNIINAAKGRFAFVRFEKKEEAEIAILRNNSSWLLDAKLFVN